MLYAMSSNIMADTLHPAAAASERFLALFSTIGFTHQCNENPANRLYIGIPIP